MLIVSKVHSRHHSDTTVSHGQCRTKMCCVGKHVGSGKTSTAEQCLQSVDVVDGQMAPAAKSAVYRMVAHDIAGY